MRILAGLGNPGEEYVETRHNAGFWVLDQIADELDVSWRAFKGGELAEVQLAGEKALLFKPMQYMNRSGEPIRALQDFYQISLEDICIAADDVYIEPGVARIRKGGADGGHNGWKSVATHLQGEFWRVRVGVGLYEQHPLKRGHQPSLEAYVLQPLPHHDRERVRHLVDIMAPKLVEWLQSSELEETTIHTI